MAFFTTLYMWDMDLVITVHADDLVTSSAKPSAGTLLNFCWLDDAMTQNKVYFILFNMADNILRNLDVCHCGLVMPYGDIGLGPHWLR